MRPRAAPRRRRPGPRGFGLSVVAVCRSGRDKTLKQALNREARGVAGHPDARSLRYRKRTAVERTNARLESLPRACSGDEFGARHVRVRGPTKVACHPMFGLLALTADRMVRLAAP